MNYFDHHLGLCDNLRYFVFEDKDNEYPYDLQLSIKSHLLETELTNQFRNSGLSRAFPFNNNGDEYFNEKDATKNPKRLAWVKDHIENIPPNQSEKLTEFYKTWYNYALTLTRSENND